LVEFKSTSCKTLCIQALSCGLISLGNLYIAPILDEISSEETDFYVGKINVDENQQLAMKFRIQSIPALMVMKNGEVVASRVGGGSKQDLLSWVKSNI
jgi:thioredoxin 1